MLKYLIPCFVFISISCNNQLQQVDGNRDGDRYDDLSKGAVNTLTTNESEIINAIIEYRKIASDEVILISDSTIYYDFVPLPFTPTDTFPDTLQKILKITNDKHYYTGNYLLNISHDYRYISRNYRNSMCQNGCHDFWDEFHSTFPKSEHGILSFSKIAVSTDSTKALAFVMWTYGSLGADGGVMSFRKDNGKWNSISYRVLLMS